MALEVEVMECMIPISRNLQSIAYYTHGDCFSVATGQTSSNCPPTSTAVIIAVTVVNILILLVSITLLVIGGVLIVKRKRHPPTVHYDKDSKTATTIYEEVDDNIALKSPGEDSKVYQDLDVSKMEGSSQYAAMK
jgi:hypothetical protein